MGIPFSKCIKRERSAKCKVEPNDTHLSYLVQPRLHGRRQRLPSLKVLWIRIFSYSGPTEKETISLRCFCKLFSQALKPLPCWTSFPHPKYSSLNVLFGRFDALSSSGSANVPKVLFIANGVHEIENYKDGHDRDRNNVKINLSISIIGESREHCIVIGCLMMKGKREDDVNVSNLTLRESKGCGVDGYNGASFHLDNVSVEKSQMCGIFVGYSKQNTMKNCQVSHSIGSGLVVMHGGVMEIEGNATTIHHNGTDKASRHCGLDPGASSFIYLVSPLTKEIISTNNDGGRNYGGKGTIKTCTNKDTKEETK